MQRTSRSSGLLAFILTGTLAGCTGDGSPPVLSLPSSDASTDAPSPLKALITPKGVVVGTPTEVYTRIARGVLTCWFGATGPLKKGYIYHAEATPASKGGNSEIKIMTRDQDAEDPRALRAYRVLISPSQDAARIEIENVRIPEPLAGRLTEDIERWSRNDEGCGETPVTAGWAAEPVSAPKGAKNKKESNKKP